MLFEMWAHSSAIEAEPLSASSHDDAECHHDYACNEKERGVPRIWKSEKGKRGNERTGEHDERI